METYEFYARCAGSLEAPLAAELKSFGIKRVRPLKGGVAFFGTLEDGYRACLWSRVASRVLLVLARVPASNAEDLYDACRAIGWEDHIAPGSTIAVFAHGMNDNLRNTQFSAVKVKDAVCDRLRAATGSRPDVKVRRPDVAIDAAIRKDKAAISIDLSGEPLHRRGYRLEGVQAEAPLKETLAAGILALSGWDAIAKEGGAFIDPFCGSGTLAIEAAMVACDMAPGMLRSHWGFTGWAGHDPALWDALAEEAIRRRKLGRLRLQPIAAGDIDPQAIDLARGNAERAGFEGALEFRIADASDLSAFQAAKADAGLLACNPPYGERLASQAQLPQIHAALAKGIAGLGPSWKVSVITPDEGIDDVLALTPFETTELRNGPLQAHVRRYAVQQIQRQKLSLVTLEGASVDVNVLEANSDQFAARFRKAAKERMKWARKNGVSCYRLYDADLPDYAVSVDLYEGAGKTTGQRFIRIAEYQAPASIDPDRARRRWNDALVLVPAILSIGAGHVFSKVRKQEKGGGQYRDARSRSHVAYTEESGYLFEIDLNGYLDTGVFLDHRVTREMLGGMAAGKRFLNLFGYTGTATVHAAGGGAASTTTVDLSQTYLKWAQRNMEANGFKGRDHAYVRADTLKWLADEAGTRRRYDLVFVDPPTFSNSKAMGDDTWSVQRDHVQLLDLVVRLLAEDGVAVFSCNLRKFRPDTNALAKLGIELEDITAQTIPEDFARNQKVHHCYLVRKGAAS